MLMGLQPKGAVQPTLFDDTDKQEKSDNLMHVMDAIIGSRTWLVYAEREQVT